MLTIADIRRIVDDHIGSEPAYARAFDIKEEIGSASFVGKKIIQQLVIHYQNKINFVQIVWKLIIKESYTECRPDLEKTATHEARIWHSNGGTTELDTEAVSNERALKACLERYIPTGEALQKKIKESEAAYRKLTGADQSPVHEPNDESMVKFETVLYKSNNSNSILFKPTIDRAGCVALMNVSIKSIEDEYLYYIFHMCVLIPDISITIATCRSLLCQDSAEILGVAMFYIRKHPALKDHVSIDDDQYNSSIRAIKQKMDINPSVECMFTVKAGKRVNLSTEFQILSLTVTYNR